MTKLTAIDQCVFDSIIHKDYRSFDDLVDSQEVLNRAILEGILTERQMNTLQVFIEEKVIELK